MRRFFLLLAIGFSIRAGLAFAIHQFRDINQYELQRTANSIATKGVFGNPYAVETGPTAHVSPGYPLILAGIYRVFGAGEQGEIVKELFSCLISSLGWALMPWVGSALRMPPQCGFLAGLAGALLPVKLSVETKGDWEAPYSALAIILLTCVTLKLWRGRTFRFTEGIQSGAAWGVSLLFFGALLPELFVFGLAGFFQGFRYRYSKFLAVQWVTVLLILSPWVIRNRLELGSPILTRSNFGLELRLSNNDDAGPLEPENFAKGVYDKYHPLLSVPQARAVAALGEVAYNRAAETEAVRWIETHKTRFAELTAKRIFYFWFQPVPGFPTKALLLDLAAIGGFAGLILFCRKEPMAATPLCLFLLMIPLPNYLVHAGLRQRYPVDWMLLLLSVYLAVRVKLRFLPAESGKRAVPRATQVEAVHSSA